MKKIQTTLKKANIAAHLCDLALGPDHHPILRYGAGGCIMLSGVVLAKVGGEIHAYHFHIFADMLGYGIHALGTVPFLEWIMEVFQRGGTVEEVVFPPIALLDDPEEGGND